MSEEIENSGSTFGSLASHSLSIFCCYFCHEVHCYCYSTAGRPFATIIVFACKAKGSIEAAMPASLKRLCSAVRFNTVH